MYACEFLSRTAYDGVEAVLRSDLREECQKAGLKIDGNVLKLTKQLIENQLPALEENIQEHLGRTKIHVTFAFCSW